MKEPNIAPFFGCLYPGLCDIARNCGYALALHGSMVNDLDLIAIPWTEEAVDAVVLKDAIKNFIGAFSFRESMEDKLFGLPEEVIDEECERVGEGKDLGPNGETKKPHGRIAWNLFLEHGRKVDLSIMPKICPS